MFQLRATYPSLLEDIAALRSGGAARGTGKKQRKMSPETTETGLQKTSPIVPTAQKEDVDGNSDASV